VSSLVKLSGVLAPIALVAVIASFLDREAAADYHERDDVRAYVDELVREHGFDPQALLTLFSDAERKESILEAIARPAERRLAWHEYREIFLGESRIEQGLAFWREHAGTLERARQDYGVPPAVVVAIIGVETRYGRHTGSYRVLDALTTLGFDYPPRADFFLGELTEYLLLAREEGQDPTALKGSYAGAMGYGQFIPSSFRAYAVDYDGDGIRDIWNNPVDAIGSVANYFARHGWRPGDPVALPVTLERPAAAELANQGLTLTHSVAELASLGVRTGRADPQARAALYRMELEDGAEFWLGMHNFYVITRYNRSRLYALAVHQLGEAIAARAAVAQAGSALE